MAVDLLVGTYIHFFFFFFLTHKGSFPRIHPDAVLAPQSRHCGPSVAGSSSEGALAGKRGAPSTPVGAPVMGVGLRVAQSSDSRRGESILFLVKGRRLGREGAPLGTPFPRAMGGCEGALEVWWAGWG